MCSIDFYLLLSETRKASICLEKVAKYYLPVLVLILSHLATTLHHNDLTFRVLRILSLNLRVYVSIPFLDNLQDSEI